jgi:fumarylacetoacetate (FAA) hydrolase family protein
LIAANLPDAGAPALRLLAPCDLHAIKPCGVTFAVSLIERVNEEQAGGDPAKALEVREAIASMIGTDLSKIKPGSDATMKLKAEPERRGAWSQYMEAVIGPDAEVFSKAQPMSAVGFGAPTWACWLRQTGAIRSRRSCCL